jgi:hypothetical protein
VLGVALRLGGAASSTGGGESAMLEVVNAEWRRSGTIARKVKAEPDVGLVGVRRLNDAGCSSVVSCSAWLARARGRPHITAKAGE